MKKLLIAIWLTAFVPGVAHSDIFGFNEHGSGLSGAGKSEWLLLDDDREASSDPYPWGITAICDGNGGYEISIALHGIVSSRPQPVGVEYAIGDEEPAAAQGFAFDSILTGLSTTLESALAQAIASGQDILLRVVSDSGKWSTSFEGYVTDPSKVEFVSNGCQ